MTIAFVLFARMQTPPREAAIFAAAANNYSFALSVDQFSKRDYFSADYNDDIYYFVPPMERMGFVYAE